MTFTDGFVAKAGEAPTIDVAPTVSDAEELNPLDPLSPDGEPHTP